MSRGLFLTFEGPEGAGKSTQIQLLVDRLEALGHAVELTREPGGTPVAEQIREVLIGERAEPMADVCELLLMLAGRADHVEKRIRPALEAGKLVICDRFVDSSAAYQGGARGLDPARVHELNRFVCGDCWPDLTILLDIEAEEGLRRAAAKSGRHDRIERAGLEFHRKVRARYLELAREEPGRIQVVDAAGDPEVVAGSVLAKVEAALGRAKRPPARRRAKARA
jgi:dTMP kinase